MTLDIINVQVKILVPNHKKKVMRINETGLSTEEKFKLH